MSYSKYLAILSACVFLPAVLVVCPRPVEGGCTIGIADGTVTADGRPLLWKCRNWSGTNNEVRHYSGVCYDYIGVRSGGAAYAMMGVNETGLCTGNSLVGGGSNGPFMTYILEHFSTVSQVRDYVHSEFNAGRLGASGCFPFMDAGGDATIFEIQLSASLYEYNSANPNRAAQGLAGRVVRANEYHWHSDGTDDLGIFGRYASGTANVNGLISVDRLSAGTIMHGNDGPNGYEFMRYGPNRPMETIAYGSVCSAMVVQGAKSGEDGRLSTMWTIMGHSNYGVATPAWAIVSDVPARMENGDLAARANSLLAKDNETDTQAATLPFETHLFDAVVEELLPQWREADWSNPGQAAEVAGQMHRVEHRMADDAFSLLYCLDETDSDNLAPTVAVELGALAGLTADFSLTSADSDGGITDTVWDYGDGQSGSISSHTYTLAGVYLVSCTVSDDDGVSQTAWAFANVPEPASFSLLTLLAGTLLLRRNRQ